MRTRSNMSRLGLALGCGAALLTSTALTQPAGAVSANYGIATKLAGEFCASSGKLDETALTLAAAAAEAGVKAAFLFADPDAEITRLEKEERDEKAIVTSAEAEAKKLQGDLDRKLLGLRLKAQSDADSDEKSVAALLRRANEINTRLAQIVTEADGLRAAIESYRASGLLGSAVQAKGDQDRLDALLAERSTLLAEKREIASDFSLRKGRLDALWAQLAAAERAARDAAKSAIAAADRRLATAKQRLDDIKLKLAGAREQSAEMDEVLQEVRRCTREREDALAAGTGGAFPIDGSLNGTYPLLVLTECQNGAGGERQSQTGTGSIALAGPSMSITLGSGDEKMTFGPVGVSPEGRVSGTVGSGAEAVTFDGTLAPGTDAEGKPHPSGSGKFKFSIDFSFIAGAVAGALTMGAATDVPSTPENIMYCDVEWEVL